MNVSIDQQLSIKALSGLNGFVGKEIASVVSYKVISEKYYIIDGLIIPQVAGNPYQKGDWSRWPVNHTDEQLFSTFHP